MPIDTARLRALCDKKQRDIDSLSMEEIAAVWNALPGLLDEVDRLRAALEQIAKTAKRNDAIQPVPYLQLLDRVDKAREIAEAALNPKEATKAKAIPLTEEEAEEAKLRW